MADYELGSLGLQIREHWKRYRPTVYAELEAAGTLAEALHQAETLTSDAMYRLEVEQGLPHHQAWELIREEWAFPPAEDDSDQ